MSMKLGLAAILTCGVCNEPLKIKEAGKYHAEYWCPKHPKLVVNVG